MLLCTHSVLLLVSIIVQIFKAWEVTSVVGGVTPSRVTPDPSGLRDGPVGIVAAAGVLVQFGGLGWVAGTARRRLFVIYG